MAQWPHHSHASANVKEVVLTKPQSDMFKLECKFPLFVAGYGTGKTFSLSINALRDALSVPKSRVGLYCPTYDLLSLNLAPRIEELLAESDIDYDYNKSQHVIRIGSSELIMRSMDNPSRIIAYEVFRSHVDEIDTIPKEKAEDIWRKIMARNRQKVQMTDEKGRPLFDENGKPIYYLNTVSCYTTPDHGFNSFTYSRWGGDNKKPGYEYVRASTLSNPHLPEDYVQTIRENYTAELAEAYINGMWCNLTTGTVYYKYNRESHRSSERVRGKETLFIGMDFNVGKMAATIYVVRENGWHAVSEFSDVFDTPAMIQAIRNRFEDNRIIVYPDASGNGRRSVDATKSDIALLRNAKFEVRVNASNPRVRDRINSVNKRFEIGALWINDKTCPKTAKSLEQQAYDKNGEPDKTSGFDHQNDATGYPVVFEFPIRRPATSGRTKGT